MSEIKTYKDFIVWQKSFRLVLNIYKISKSFPDEEKFCITQQMRKSAISIPSNIAEGFGRNHTKEYIRFLQIACGSLYELETQLEICYKLNYINDNDQQELNELCIEIGKMLNSLIRKLTR